METAIWLWHGGGAVDAAISGDDTERRVEFLRLRTDCENGPDFKTILCWDQDRLSRNDPLEIGFWLKPIRDAGVVVETPQGKVDWETFAGRMVYLIQQEGKHAYLRDLSRNVTRGALAAARNGKRHGTGGGGPRLYGYRTRLDGTVEVVSDEALVVRRIFERYLEPGVGLRAVASMLNADGIKTAAGGLWTQTRIRETLTNAKYVGSYVRFRKVTGKYNGVVGGEIVTRSRGDKAIVQTPLIVVGGNHEAIIDQATFDAAQAKLTSNRAETARRDAHPYVFRGLLVCGECEVGMVGHRGTSYLCQNYKRSGTGTCHANHPMHGSGEVGRIRNGQSIVAAP